MSIPNVGHRKEPTVIAVNHFSKRSSGKANIALIYAVEDYAYQKQPNDQEKLRTREALRDYQRSFECSEGI